MSYVYIMSTGKLLYNQYIVPIFFGWVFNVSRSYLWQAKTILFFVSWTVQEIAWNSERSRQVCVYNGLLRQHFSHLSNYLKSKHLFPERFQFKSYVLVVMVVLKMSTRRNYLYTYFYLVIPNVDNWEPLLLHSLIQKAFITWFHKFLIIWCRQ